MTPIYFVFLEGQTVANQKLVHFAQTQLPKSEFHGIYVGQNTATVEADYGCEQLSHLDTMAYENYNSYDAVTISTNLATYFETKPAGVVLFPEQHDTTSVAVRLAAKLRQPMLTRILNIDASETTFTFQKKVFSGSLLRQWILQPDQGIVVTCDLTGVSDQVENSAVLALNVVEIPVLNESFNVTYTKNPVVQGQSIDQAEIVVAGGRGLKDAEGFQQIQVLAKQLSAGVGASRAAVDADWVENSAMIGQSGKTIAPKVYFAIGISGTVQHTVGMDQAQCVIAINKDKDAPIFKLADYGIVGDIQTILPQLLKALPVVSTN